MNGRLTRILTRFLLGTVPVIALLLTWPATPARAFPYGIDDIINTINGTLSPAISSTNSSFQSIQSTEQSVIFPPGAIFQTQGNITTIVNGYRGWMSQVYTQPLSSAQLLNTSQLESLLHSGSSTTTPAIASLYQSTYGAGPISSAAAPPTIQQIVDMNDAHAISGLSLATATDQSASSLIAMANQIEDQSTSTAPGTADQLTAQAMALQLQSLAAQHQLLASQLRQEAGILAQQTSEMKRSATSTQSMNNVLQNLLNTTK